MASKANMLAVLFIANVATAHAEGLEFPRVIRTHYESLNPKLGGQFLLWSERDRIQYGLNPKLYPGALAVTITQVSPGDSTSVLTYVDIRTTKGKASNSLFFAGPTRFRISGMRLNSSNLPAGSMPSAK